MIDMSLPQNEPAALPERSFGRVARSVAGYAFLTALMIVTPMVVFVPAALLHCAIRNGRRAAWATLLIGVGLASLYVAAIPQATPEAGRLAWAFVAWVVLAIAVPTMAALPMVERGEKFGRVLVFVLIASAIGMLVMETGAHSLMSYSPYAAQVAQAQQSNAEVVEFYKTNGMPADMVQFAQKWAGYSTFVLPASILIMTSLVFIVSLLMLGRLKAWRALAARRADIAQSSVYLFRNFSLPDWMLFAFVLGGLTPLAHGMLQTVAANVLAVTAFLYILQGLAIFRFLLAAMGAGFAGTMLGWLLLLFLTITGIGPLLLGMAGLFDPFFDFRHFKKRKDDSNESHSD
jgi:hypothetical protein